MDSLVAGGDAVDGGDDEQNKTQNVETNNDINDINQTNDITTGGEYADDLYINLDDDDTL